MNYDRKIEEGISRYLEKVASYLRETPADETDEIIRDLQSHIYDALAGRSGAEPTLADLEAVLSEMDPPESYAAPAPGDAQPPPAKPTTGRSLGSWALAALIAGVILPILLAAAGAIFGRDSCAKEDAIGFAAALGIILELLALILGLVSWREKTGKAAAIGAGVIILIVLVFGLWWVSYEGSPTEVCPMKPQRLSAPTQLDPETQSIRQLTSQPADADSIAQGIRLFIVRVESDLCPADLKVGERVDVMGKFSVKDQPVKTYPIIGGLKIIAIGGRGPGTTSDSMGKYRSVTLEVRHKVCSGLINVLPHAEGSYWLQRSSPGSIPFSIGTINPELHGLPSLDTPSNDE